MFVCVSGAFLRREGNAFGTRDFSVFIGLAGY